jgi:DNA polymerase IV
VRKIIHIDMDCFFAAVEIRDDPRLKGQPVAVGGYSSKRGVIATASYEARTFGVYSALSTAEALRRCPNLKLIQPNMKKYKEASRQIYAILYQFSDIIEPISIDEAFIDITQPKIDIKTATLAAKAIRQKIFEETGLAASAGIAPNPFLAKVASDWHKPNGQFTITPDMVSNFIYELPLRKVPGVGKITEEKLLKMGFATCGDLQTLKIGEMAFCFGKWGTRLFELCRGKDDRKLGLKRERKSLSVEKTFPNDLETINSCLESLRSLIEELLRRYKSIEINGIKSIFVKLKFSDFKCTTVDDCTLTTMNFENYRRLFVKARSRSTKPIRLIGIGIRLLESINGPIQLELFSENSAC